MITGGTGSFGHQMITELMNFNPKEIRIFSRDEAKQHTMNTWLSETNLKDKIKFFIGDVRDFERLSATMKNVDVIFHAAALKQVPTVESHVEEAVKTNIMGARNIVKAAADNNVADVIAISTDKAVKPVNAMGMTKALQEKLIISDEMSKGKTTFSCVRYGNVLGSRASVLPVWDERINKGRPIPITHPEMRRFFPTLHEAISLVFYAVENANGGEIFIRKAPASKIIDLAKAYAEIMSGDENYPMEMVGIRAGEKIDEVLVSEEEMRHAKESQDHFVIEREKEFNTYTELLNFEYSTKTTTQLGVRELKNLIIKMKWIE